MRPKMSDYLSNLSCSECGDTVRTYRHVPPYCAVWCGRQICLERHISSMPSSSWESVLIVDGFSVMRLLPSSVNVSTAENVREFA
jgi:hypothetical protein